MKTLIHTRDHFKLEMLPVLSAFADLRFSQNKFRVKIKRMIRAQGRPPFQPLNVGGVL